MPYLEIAHLALLVAHFVGLVALIGLCLAVVQRRRGADATSMRSLCPIAGGLASADIVVAMVWA